MTSSSTSRDERARRLARLLLVSGLLNSWCLAGFAWAALGSVIGPWGWMACALAPFGVLELAAGLYARSSERPARVVSLVAVLQVAAITIGACPSALIGGWILWSLREP